jgi:hypothetical protein
VITECARDPRQLGVDERSAARGECDASRAAHLMLGSR